MDTSEVIKTATELGNTIQMKYNKIMKELDDLGEELKQIPIKYSKHTKQYQEEQKIKLSNKIEAKRINAEAWFKNQMESVDNWLNSRKDDILKEEFEKNQSENNQIDGFIKSIG